MICWNYTPEDFINKHLLCCNNIKSNGHFCWVLKRLIISNNNKKSHCAIIYWAAAVAGAKPEIYWMAYKYITGEPPKLYREEGSPNSQVEEEVRNNYSWLNTRTYGKNAERLTLIWINRYLAQHSLNCLFLKIMHGVNYGLDGGVLWTWYCLENNEWKSNHSSIFQILAF